MNAAVQAVPELGPSAACEALGVSRASLHRLRNPPLPLPEPRPRPSPPRALTAEERGAVLGHLHAERFQDRSPAEVYSTLLDEGVYCCSIRTLYRILSGEGEARERRDQLTHPRYQKPQLLANGPNQLWSWDITKLLGPAKWTYFYLYVILGDRRTCRADCRNCDNELAVFGVDPSDSECPALQSAVGQDPGSCAHSGDRNGIVSLPTDTC